MALISVVIPFVIPFGFPFVAWVLFFGFIFSCRGPGNDTARQADDSDYSSLIHKFHKYKVCRSRTVGVLVGDILASHRTAFANASNPDAAAWRPPSSKRKRKTALPRTMLFDEG
jgi:hypothetical protein